MTIDKQQHNYHAQDIKVCINCAEHDVLIVEECYAGIMCNKILIGECEVSETGVCDGWRPE
jgi:hypothetical protein